MHTSLALHHEGLCMSLWCVKARCYVTRWKCSEVFRYVGLFDVNLVFYNANLCLCAHKFGASPCESLNECIRVLDV